MLIVIMIVIVWFCVKVIMVFGMSWVLILFMVVVVGVFGWRGCWIEVVVLLVVVVIILIVVLVIKESIDCLWFVDLLVVVPGVLYLSGYAVYLVFYVWLVLMVVVWVWLGWKYGTVLIVIGFAFMGLIGFSCVYFGVYYLSDVSGGWVLGVSVFVGCVVLVMVVMYVVKLWYNYLVL